MGIFQFGGEEENRSLEVTEEEGPPARGAPGPAAPHWVLGAPLPLSPPPFSPPARLSPASPRAGPAARSFAVLFPSLLPAPRLPAPTPGSQRPARLRGPRRPRQARPRRSAGGQCVARCPPGAGAGSRARSEPDRPPPPARIVFFRERGTDLSCRQPEGLSRRHAAAPAGPAGPGRLLGTGPVSGLVRATLGLLSGTHHPAGGNVGDGGDLRQSVREHRGRLRRGHRPVPLPRARCLLLLLHRWQGSAQEPVGDAGAQSRRGAGAGLRRAAAPRHATRRQPERHAAARLRRHGVAAAARRPAVRAGRAGRHLQRLPGVRRRRRACARAARAPRAAFGLLGSAHAQPGGLGRGPGAAAPAARLRHGARQHRRRLRRGCRRVPLSPARRLFLLLHTGQAAAQDAVGEADEEPRRGAGHDLRRRRVAAPRDAEPERDAGAAARRRRLAAQPRPRRLRRLQQPRQVHHLLRLPGVPRRHLPRPARPARPRAPGALSPEPERSPGRSGGVHAEAGPRPERPAGASMRAPQRGCSANKVGLRRRLFAWVLRYVLTTALCVSGGGRRAEDRVWSGPGRTRGWEFD
uniref:Translation initiation factor IF-2 n=1 Tax=Camelus bactrianus TaxID=9837 RepID=A0A9W3F2N1_CAMBA|nr:translation initiation factor IF-2 [Camelus bactrianus]